MRKITLFLSVLFMAIVVKAQRELVKSWDFAAIADTMTVADMYMTYSDETTKVGGTASNFGTGIWEGLAMQGADKFYIRTATGGLYNGNGGGRKVGVLNLTNEQIVTVVVSEKNNNGQTGTQFALADDSNALEISVETVDGKTTYVYEMTADGMLALSMTRYFTLFSITVENPDPNAVEVPVTGISLDKNTAEITEGMVLNLLTATITPVDATDRTITWSSSEESIAKVNNGQVTGVAVGTATITAEAGGFTATCEVTVKEKVVKTSWDFAAFYETYGNKAGMTHAVNTVKVGGKDCNYGVGEYEGLAAQEAGGWFLYSSGGLYNGNSGGRNIGVLDLNEGQIITIVANAELTLADATSTNQLSVETVDGVYTYLYEMITDGTLALTVSRNKTLVSIKVEDTRELVVTDGEDLDAEGTYTGATYERKFNTEYSYGTICLPFAPDAATCANYTFYKLTESNSETLYFEEETEPKANVAYLYKLNEGVDAEEAKTFTGGVTTIAEVESEAVGGWQLIGSFKEEKITDLTDGEYFVYKPVHNEKKDVFVKATNSLTVKPYRAYFKFVETQELNFAPAAAVMFLSIGGEDNGTNKIEKVVTPEEVEGAVFDMEGRPVEKMQDGKIYIVGGQKVIK